MKGEEVRRKRIEEMEEEGVRRRSMKARSAAGNRWSALKA